MATMSSYLRLLRYSSPFVVSTGGIFLSAASACLVAPTHRALLSPSQRAASKHITAWICSLHLLDGLLQVLRATREGGWSAGPDPVAYTTLSFLLWLVIFIIQSDANRLFRFPNLATWALAFFLDTVITFASFHTAPSGSFEFIDLSIGIVRIAILLFLCLSVTVPVASYPVRDSEWEPLLRSSREERSQSSIADIQDVKHADSGAYGILPSSQQIHRIEQAGGWWAYLREIKFLLPYVIPLKDKRRRFYALVMATLMVGGRVSQLFGPRLLGNIVQAISNNKTDSSLFRQIMLYMFAVRIPYEVILEPARKWLSVRLFYSSYLELLLSLASHVAGLSYAFHENKQTGEIIAAIGQGQIINQFVDDFMESTLPLVLDIVVAFAYVTYLFDVYVALLLTSTYIVYAIVTYKGTILSADARRKYRETSRIEWDVLHESIANWMSTFYLNRQEYQHIRLGALSRREINEQMYDYDVSMVMRTCQALVVALGYLGILLRTSHLTTHTKDAVGDFVALLFYWSLFINPLYKLAHFYHSLAQVLVDVERLRQLMQIEPTVRDNACARQLHYRDGKIEYRNVSFSYDGKNSVVDNLNFTISPGSTVAFVGHSGGGKTTTCDKLLFRAYDVTAGAILIDDQDIRSVTQKSLRDVVGIVRQEPVFNNDTVLENVRYARLGASDAEVVAACKDAAIHEQIMKFPMGYNTIVGERGVKLSGGERQRLAIAQLFLRDPKIVVLDEATSSVDNIAESEIQEAFARICRGRTTIVIAHRLSTVQHADQIFVLDKGTIAERGSHDELLGKHGKYFQLWNKTKRVGILKGDLARVKSRVVEERDTSVACLDLSDNSDVEDESHCPPDIVQIDGSSSSRHVDEPSTRMGKRMHNLREKLIGNTRTKDDKSNDEGDAEDVDEANFEPIRMISPRATDTRPPPAASRRASRFLPRSPRPRKATIVPTPKPRKKVQPRTISAPILPVRVQTNRVQPLHPQQIGNVQMRDRTSTNLRRISNVSTPSRIPVSISPLTTPIRGRQSVAREILLRSPQSPRRDAALRSHPVSKSDMGGHGSGKCRSEEMPDGGSRGGE